MVISHSGTMIGDDDYAAVAGVLKSGWLAQGPQVIRFEDQLSSFLGVKGAVAVSSGTAGLHLALRALGVDEGDEVILPSYVCTALLNAVCYVKARAVIVDIENDTFNVDVVSIKGHITDKTKAIIVPHMFGLPAEIEAICDLGIPVIEDCAQSLGARFRGRMTGSFGICSVFSFYATKVIATGEGGMVASDNEELRNRIKNLRDYDERDFYEVRYNYKMTDIQAALGISQLNKLPGALDRRSDIAHIYEKILRNRGIAPPAVPEERRHIYYRYVITLDDNRDFTDKMKSHHIECRRPVYKPLHAQLGFPACPVTDDVFSRAVSIPLYPSLDDEDVERIAMALEDALPD